MGFRARILRLGRRPDPGPDPEPVDEEPAAPAAPPDPETRRAAQPPAGTVTCPSCGVVLDPPPVRNRRCPACRQPIVVRRTDGRTVYLAEATVEVFEREQRRRRDLGTWTAAREAWLRLAREAGAPADRCDRLASRPLDEDTVAKARALYETAATRAIRAHARAGAWERAAAIGRELAAARHRADGATAPPDPETAAIHAEAMRAQLRSLRGAGTHAELVGGRCCPTCRADDGRVLPIDAELRDPRLPHAGCPRGLCACEWWFGGTVKAARRKARRGTP